MILAYHWFVRAKSLELVRQQLVRDLAIVTAQRNRALSELEFVEGERDEALLRLDAEAGFEQWRKDAGK